MNPTRTCRRAVALRRVRRPAAVVPRRAVRPNASAIGSMACGAWRIRIWVAALATTAWPRSEPRRSAASWVMTVSPGVAFAGRLRHPVQEPGAFAVVEQRPGLVDDDEAARGAAGPVAVGRSTSRQIASSASSVPAARSSSGSCRIDHTTRCPSGWVVVGPSNRSRNEPATHGASRAASCAAGVAAAVRGGGPGRGAAGPVGSRWPGRW